MAKLPSSSSSSSGFALEFLRRLLCAHRHSTGGGSNATDSAHSDAPVHLSAPEPEGRSPCVVARLMGLDAMPMEMDTPHAQAQTLRRSRSASSAEGGKSPCGLGRSAEAGSPVVTVRASASLRERPAYLREENDMFLLLSFSPEDPEDRDTTSKACSGEEGDDDGPRKQRRRHRRKLRFGDDDDDATRRECNAQGSSPVSVLEAHEESSTTTTTSSSSVEDAEPCSATSSEEEAHFALEQQSSARKLHRSFVQPDDMLSPPTTTTTSTVPDSSKCSDKQRRNRKMVNKYYEESTPDVNCIWHPVCILVEEDLRSMEWLTRGNNNISDICDMDSEILDQLVCEVTDELVQLSFDASPISCAYPPPNVQQSEVPKSNKHTRFLEAPEHE